MTALPYLDPKLPPAERAADLVQRMSLEEKAGLLFHTIVTPASTTAPAPPFVNVSTADYIAKGLNHFNLLGKCGSAEEYGQVANEIQAIAAKTRWSIPVTISTDPRHAFSADNPFTSFGSSGVLSEWPESLGMVAIGSEERMEEQAEIIRREYRAIGIAAALHPQVDLATEPQWSRIAGGLGEDSKLAAKLGAAQVRGLRGKGAAALGPASVSACVKHFPGCAPAKDGFDPHFSWGSDLIYPGGNMEYHLEPFKAAIAANAAVFMPAYGKPVGTKYEEVSMAFNKGILTDLLRKDLGFKGIILSDWGVLEDWDDPEGKMGDIAQHRAWGKAVENLTSEELVVRALDAGIDQFGGDACPEVVVAVVKSGAVPESRIDESARRLLQDKFALGLFDNRYVDAAEAQAILSDRKSRERGFQAQMDSLVVLKNDRALPLPHTAKVYSEGFKDGFESSELFTHVESLGDADVAVIRTATSHDPSIGKGLFAAMFHHGSLEFSAEFVQHVAGIAKSCPVILVVAADRPPILGQLNEIASSIVFTFGGRDKALVNVLCGVSPPRGKLPFDVPRSMEAVKASKADVPFDTENPTYRFGHGLGDYRCE